jgi:uncharacterized protein (TIGR01244 family)
MRDCDVTTGKRWFIMAVSFVVLTTYAEETEWNSRLEPADGITAADQPNEANLRELSETGFAAVIDLRTDSENRGFDEQNLVQSLGMEYISLPIAGRGALNFDNARKLNEILSHFDKPVLVHCGSGNRVGALFALREIMNGAEKEDALAFGRSAGMTSLEDTVIERMAEK